MTSSTCRSASSSARCSSTALVVHFGDGSDQTLDLRDVIPAGGHSRIIDLEGGDRVIRSIDFWYDAQSIGRGKGATVRVFGQH